MLIGTRLNTSFGVSSSRKKNNNGVSIIFDADSTFARTLAGTLKNVSEELMLDLSFVVEGRKEEELPERLLASFRLGGVDFQRIQKDGTGKGIFEV